MSNLPDFCISHIGFYVSDFEKMEEFYKNFFGFEVTDRADTPTVKIVFMSRDPKEHHQIALFSGKPKDLTFNPINQISMRVGTLADLKYYYQKMKELPSGMVTDVDPIAHGMAISLYFRDPEGNRLELFVDAPWYCDQPLKVPFNPEDSDEHIWSWMEELARSTTGFKMMDQWMEEFNQKLEAKKL